MPKINYKKEKLIKAIRKLEEVYKRIPSTTGCMENISKEKGCNGWCCVLQNPHLLYSEFLNTLNNIMSNWTPDDILAIIEKCLQNYLSENPTKTCVFFDRDSKKCLQHGTRPLACRVYGIEPKSSYDRKLESLRREYNDEEGLYFRNQCNLVKTEDGTNLTEEDCDKFWNELVKIEKEIGIKGKDINDSAYGTYKTYHDHFLMYLLPDITMENLSSVRKFGTREEKLNIVSTFINIFKDQLYKTKQNEKTEEK